MLYDILINIYSRRPSYAYNGEPKHRSERTKYFHPPQKLFAAQQRLRRIRTPIIVHKHSYFVNKFTLSSDCHKTMICPYKLVI